MDSDQSDTIDDPGRKESEQRLKNAMSSKYLDEVIEKTGMDYDEAVEAIEREKKTRDSVADGTANTYGMDLHTETIDWYARNTHTMPVRPKPASNDRQDFVQAREEDKERVKDLLAVGKRVAEGETEVKQGEGTRQVIKGEDLKGFFDEIKRNRPAELEKRVKLMQKGVKKMCEEIESMK